MPKSFAKLDNIPASWAEAHIAFVALRGIDSHTVGVARDTVLVRTECDSAYHLKYVPVHGEPWHFATFRRGGIVELWFPSDSRALFGRMRAMLRKLGIGISVTHRAIGGRPVYVTLTSGRGLLDIHAMKGERTFGIAPGQPTQRIVLAGHVLDSRNVPVPATHVVLGDSSRGSCDDPDAARCQPIRWDVPSTPAVYEYERGIA